MGDDAPYPTPALLVAANIILALSAFARSDDPGCRARLAELAVGYVGQQISGQNQPDSDLLVAVDRGDHGDTAAGVPILERKLLDGRFTPPPR